MEIFEYITRVLAAGAALGGLLVASDQLTQGARERRLELFLREAAGQNPNPVLASVRRTLVARTVARNAVPLSRCIFPITWLAVSWGLISVGLYQDSEDWLTVLFAVLIGVTTAFPFMMLALWRHERSRAVEALERGDVTLRIYTGTTAMQSVSFRGVGRLAGVGPIASAIIGLWASVTGEHLNPMWSLLASLLVIPLIILLAGYFADARKGPYVEPKIHNSRLEPSWAHPRIYPLQPGSSQR